MKILPVRAELSREDGRTDKHDKANSHFSQFCERTYKITVLREKRPTVYNLRPTHFCHLGSLSRSLKQILTEVHKYTT